MILLHPDDDVCAAAAPLEPGEILRFQGAELRVLDQIPLGHKIAVRDLGKGDKVHKYGASIGSATQPIRTGEWVHLHNLRSDYLPTFERGHNNSGTQR